MLRQHSKSSGGGRNADRLVKVKGVRVMHSVTNIFTKEKTISSLEVAEMVEKEHKNLMRDVRNYVAELNQLKIEPVDFFQESKYKDGKGEERPCYNITKKGCEFIAHKLTGIKGTKFTALYINRFHDMEEQLKPKVPQTYLEALKELVAVEEEKERLQLELDRSKDWYSIKRVAALNSVSWKTFDWRKLKQVGEQMGYEVRKIFDANYGEVNTYHREVWETAYPRYEI